MIILPAYAVIIWVLIAMFRRQWQGFVILAFCAFPVFILTHLCVNFFPMNSIEPRPGWLYGIAGAYAFTVVVIGLVIAVQRRDRQLADCHACGYDLTGATALACPECGSAIRCLRCHAEITGPLAPRCAICGELPPTFPPQTARTPLPERAPDPPSVRARRFAARRPAGPDSRHDQRHRKSNDHQPDRPARLRTAR